MGDPRVSADSSGSLQNPPQPLASSFNGVQGGGRSRSERSSTSVTSGGRHQNHHRNHEPYFAEGVSGELRNMSAQLGTTTYLHCKVNSLGGKTVEYNSAKISDLFRVILMREVDHLQKIFPI